MYPPGGPKKHDLGDGLNKPAEITLYKIFKRDKSTGQPTTDPKEQEKFARKLQESATKQNTEFVSFDKDRGIWKFRVDHFSRLVLLLCYLPITVGLLFTCSLSSASAVIRHAYCAVAWASVQQIQLTSRELYFTR